MQLIEMAEAEAIFSGTDQIQLEVMTIMRSCRCSVNLYIFTCQEISYEATIVSDCLPYRNSLIMYCFKWIS